jgi:hypothetical protein
LNRSRTVYVIMLASSFTLHSHFCPSTSAFVLVCIHSLFIHFRSFGLSFLVFASPAIRLAINSAAAPTTSPDHRLSRVRALLQGLFDSPSLFPVSPSHFVTHSRHMLRQSQNISKSDLIAFAFSALPASDRVASRPSSCSALTPKTVDRR